jgi:hypothetical protein
MSGNVLVEKMLKVMTQNKSHHSNKPGHQKNGANRDYEKANLHQFP